MENIHFCGGLPRSGSTVLMSLLQQNPRIFTTGSCALYEILHDKILIKGRYSETFQSMSTDQADRAMYGLIHGATKGWFEALTNKPIVVSKRHGWSGLFHLFPKSKYICLVRDLRDVVESFERVNTKIRALHTYGNSNALLPSMHIHEKYRHYFEESNSLVSNLQTEVPRLMEVFQKDRSRVMFIRYEDFTKEPHIMLSKMYKFLNEDYCDHDLANIKQSELFEHDHAYFRERTDHEVMSEFRLYTEPKRTLPESFHNKIVKEYSWYYNAFYPEVKQ
jgi:sulfotransferase